MRTALVLALAAVTLGTAFAQPAPPDTLRAPAALMDSLTVFGWSVAADDATLLVGAEERRDVAARSAGAAMSDPKGTVLVYRLTDAGPVLDGRLVSDRLGNQDCFSLTLDVHGDLAAVGAFCEFEPPSGVGAIYLFRRDADGWHRDAKLLATDVSEPYRPTFEFGHSFALGDDLLVLSASFDNSATVPGDENSGAVVVFERQGGAWGQTNVILNDDASVAVNEAFGRGIALSGPRGAETLFVGAPYDSDLDMYRRGSVYVFEHVDGAWVQRAKLLCDHPRALAFCGGTIVAGPQSEAVVTGFESLQPLDRIDGVWTLGATLDSRRSISAFGLARHSDEIASVGKTDETSIHVFRRDGGGWRADSLALVSMLPYAEQVVALDATHRFVGQAGYGSDAANHAVLIYRRDGTVAAAPVPAPTVLALRLAPNPTAGAATVYVSLPAASSLRTEVVDVQGRVVWRAEEAAAAGDHAVALDLRGVAAGVYVVRVTAGGETGQTTLVRR